MTNVETVFGMVTCQLLIGCPNDQVSESAKQQRTAGGCPAEPPPMVKSARTFMRVSKCY
jgi:hypothetical protein